MSFDEAFAADTLPMLYEQFGIDATVQRGEAAPVPVRVIIDYSVQQAGQGGQVLAEYDQASFMVAQWRPEKSDVLVYSNRFGPTTRRVGSIISDDGFEAKVVIRG